MTIVRIAIFLIVFLALLPISFLQGTNYYVATSYGSESNNGTSIISAFKTIGKA